MIKKLNLTLTIVIIIIIIIMVINALKNINCGIDNINMIFTFSIDEYHIVKQVAKNLEYNEINPDKHFNYGYFYNSLGFYFLKCLNLIGINIKNVKIIAYILRLISVLSYIFLLLIFYLSAKKIKISSEIALIFTFFLGSIYSIYYWSQLIHPDVLQTFLIVLSVYCVILKQNFIFLILSSVFAGLAFGTKYSGIFILPFLFIPYTANIILMKIKFIKKINIISFSIILFLIVFIISWISMNPYVISDSHEFIKDFIYEKKHISIGHGRVESENIFLWFVLLYKEFLITGSLIVVLGFYFCFMKIIKILKQNIYNIKKEEVILISTLILYCVSGFIYLMLEVNMRRPRYLFHIFPFIILISCYGFNSFMKNQTKKNKLIFNIILLVSISYISYNSILKTKFLSEKNNHEYIKAGKWLKNNYPSDIKVLADIYSYIPPNSSFNYYFVWFVNPNYINKYNPDVIIINEKCSGRMSWKQKNTNFSELCLEKKDFNNADFIFKFHKYIFNNINWKIVYESENIVILEKNKKKFFE